jgi:universal stress protein E
MRPIRRILIAVKDPSAVSVPAVDKGAQLAQALGAQVELFHAIATPLYVDAYSPQITVQEIERQTRDKTIKLLEKIAARLRVRGLTVDVSATWDFPVYEAIVRRATRSAADLIVAERHAQPHIMPGLLRITDWELLRTSTVPVLLVKTTAPYQRPVVLAAVDPEHSLAKPATLDREIVNVARSITSALRGSLHAVNAYTSLPQTRHMSDAALRRLSANNRRNAQRGFGVIARAAKIPKNQRHLVGRPPIDAIEQTARKTHSSIVVMGAIARSGMRRFFFGNTAEVLLDSLNCDMLIVKPPGFAPRVQRRVRGVRFAASAYLPGM